jgi:metal-sulfur cluster biosynthetic enzyme
MATEEDVREKLKECYDPEIPINIVDLGLIYDLDIEGEEIDITMTLTAVGCPVADEMKAQVEAKAQEVEGIEEVSCEIVFEPPWSPDQVTEEGEAALSSLGVL